MHSPVSLVHGDVTFLYCLGRWSSAQSCVSLVHNNANSLVLSGQVEFSTELCFSCPQRR